MNYSADYFYLIFMLFLGAFIVTAGLTLRGRRVIKIELKGVGCGGGKGSFGKAIGESSINNGLREVSFFIVGRWDFVRSPLIVKRLIKHRRLEILTILIFVIAKGSLLLALFLDGKINIS